MRRDDPNNWMWSEAIAMPTRAERLHRNFFLPRRDAQQAEPPVDVLELADEVLILVALPGIDPDTVDAAIDGGSPLVRAGARISRNCAPSSFIGWSCRKAQGRFERSIPLPPGRYASVQRSAAYGCLVFSLRKSAIATNSSVR